MSPHRPSLAPFLQHVAVTLAAVSPLASSLVGWLLGGSTAVVLLGWLLLTAAEGETPKVLGDVGAIGAMIAGAILLAKVLAPVVLRLIPENKAGPGDKEDGRWQGEISTMVRVQTDAFRDISIALREHTQAIRDLVRDSQDYHAEGRRFMDEQRRSRA